MFSRLDNKSARKDDLVAVGRWPMTVVGSREVVNIFILLILFFLFFFFVCYFSRLLIRVLKLMSPSPMHTYDNTLVSPTPDPGLDPNDKRICGGEKNKTKKRKPFCQIPEILIFQTFLVKELEYTCIFYVVLYVAGLLNIIYLRCQKSIFYCILSRTELYSVQ